MSARTTRSSRSSVIDGGRQGAWNPQDNEDDRKNRDALAARGYWQAFQSVKDSVAAIITGVPAGALVRDQHGTWYRELFQPSVAAGLLRPGTLAGYFNLPVYVRGSRHVPPRWEAVPDAMETLFGLLDQEPNRGCAPCWATGSSATPTPILTATGVWRAF